MVFYHMFLEALIKLNPPHIVTQIPLHVLDLVVATLPMPILEVVV